MGVGVHHGDTEGTEKKRFGRAKRAILRFSVTSVPPWSVFSTGAAPHAIALG